MSNFWDKGVAIIGAGLGGTALALALHQKGIPCRIYETRGPEADVVSSGIIITPNGGKVLHELGALEGLSSRSFQFEHYVFKNDKDETTEKTAVPTDLYGYKHHRLYRIIILQQLKTLLAQRGVVIHYNSKFERFVSETAEGVRFQINENVEEAAIVVGADGIHSTVRAYLNSAVPEYTGILSLYGHIPASSVAWPDQDFLNACTIQGKPGSFFLVPEVADASDLMVGTQFPFPEQDRRGWDAMTANKAQLTELFRKNYSQWHATGASIVDAVCKYPDTLLIWPFYKVPVMPTWSSATGRVIIIGDAAHAMPASSGQGLNQALEDAYTLARLLSSIDLQSSLPEALGVWHGWRQTKVDKIFEMAMATNLKRLPEAERLRLSQANTSGDEHVETMDSTSPQWLFDLHLDDLDAALTQFTE
ncbi:kynurenine 3-monooxygenase [Fusarium denticulatum]|uniref:Kynurenine 3-monooxygenase n=1 Tax=Fusarium denticulatum TaxID=48507 RepID=A0A8H5TJ00_9HYPO|nr:kynurenine 3-monooxygenase [Fusarium denticulatum]